MAVDFSGAILKGLYEESLGVFDLLEKNDLSGSDIRRIKKISVCGGNEMTRDEMVSHCMVELPSKSEYTQVLV